MEIKDYNLEDLELAYAKIKIDLGKKIAEQRENAGFPKVSYHGGKKSANLLFNTESGANLPNRDTLEYYIELYQVRDKTAEALREMHNTAKKIKTEIIRKKRGWS